MSTPAPLPVSLAALRRPGWLGRGLPLLIWIGAALVLGALLADEWLRVERGTLAIARERGYSLFSLIQTTREWNARHGGVYVPVTDEMQPNPYLHHPRRDLPDGEGGQLTLVNPAFMTRQIAELAGYGEGVKLHITSLRPLRPENAADPWERAALDSFETGNPERLELVEADGVPVYRFMAPLRVGTACLQCHAEQNYLEGDIRGGISVTMPAAPLLALRDAQRLRLVFAFALVFVGVAGLLHYLYRLVLRHLLIVDRIHAGQEQLIAHRTAELRQSHAELAASEARYRAIFDSAGEGVALIDGDLRLLKVNPAFTVITGYAADEVCGESLELLGSGRQEKDFFTVMQTELARSGRWQGEVWNRRKSGDAYVQWLSVARTSLNGERPAYVLVMSDITVRKEAELRMQYRAHHDPLTDLPNRALFEDRLKAVLARADRSGERFGVLFMDLDRFKQVNDTFGHPAGDALLIESAQRITACTRASDTVARLGGDEFAVVVGRVNTVEDAAEVAERICVAIARPFVLPQGQAEVAASVGIALWPEHGEDAASLQAHADQALYVAKRAGGNRWHLYVAGEAEGKSVRERS